MKDILGTVIKRLGTQKRRYCRIKHKRGWLEYLEDGGLGFKPSKLHNIFRQVVDSEGNRPRGNKLLTLRRKTSFTARKNKAPYRPEEALERFIIVSNSDDFYNQVPIGGRKESIDIGIKENNSKLIFVELKPWKSNDSPLYAIVESLKNFMEYRIIQERNIKRRNDFDEIELMILAPEAYYMAFDLIDKHGKTRIDKIPILKKTLTSINSKFKVDISLMVLQLDENNFHAICRKIYDNQKVIGQGEIHLSETDSIPILARDKWKLLVSSG
jgi:hypothetical protein